MGDTERLVRDAVFFGLGVGDGWGSSVFRTPANRSFFG